MTKEKTISQKFIKPTREEAMAAVRTMLAWAGDDPNREGLLDTPKRVVNSYEEFFSGYAMNPYEILNKNIRKILKQQK